MRKNFIGSQWQYEFIRLTDQLKEKASKKKFQVTILLFQMIIKARNILINNTINIPKGNDLKTFLNIFHSDTINVKYLNNLTIVFQIVIIECALSLFFTLY
jgi:hypothetical protein